MRLSKANLARIVLHALKTSFQVFINVKARHLLQHAFNTLLNQCWRHLNRSFNIVER